jgi:FkbM family methyltransferase
MKDILKKMSGFLPKHLKTIITPFYRRIVSISRRSVIDKPSTIKIETFMDFEVAYRKGTTDEAVIRHSFDRDIFFSSVPEYQTADDHVIIDIGAHIGTFSLLASSKVQRGKVYAIEACEDSFNLLRINVALNNATNISAHHLAITDRQGTCKLYYASGNWGHSLVSPLSKHFETVPSCTLSDFLESNKIDKCHFMKLNCEGAEFPILLSTPHSILQRFRIILALYHCDLWRNNTETDLLSHLQSGGFNTLVRNRSERRGWIIAINNT